MAMANHRRQPTFSPKKMAAPNVTSSGLAWITAAMRVGEIAAVTPFRYARLVFAFFIALVVFDESIDGLTLLGVAIVIATGLYSLWRERQLRHAA